MAHRSPNVLFFTITGNKFVINILIRTTKVIPWENGLLHLVLWSRNTREYGVCNAHGFNQSKVAIDFKPGITYQMIDIYYLSMPIYYL